MGTKNRIANILLRVAALLLMLLLISWLISCGSKKKLTQKTQFTTEIATVERIKEKTETETKTDISTTQTIKESTTLKEEVFQGEIADTSKPATVTTQEKDGKQIRTYTNFKNVNTGAQISASETNKTSGQNLSKIDKSKTGKESETESKSKASGSERNSNVEKIGLQIPFYWWIILTIIVLGYLVISYLKNSLNPRNWI